MVRTVAPLISVLMVKCPSIPDRKVAVPRSESTTRAARHQFAEHPGGNARQVVAIGVADQRDAEDADPQHKVAHHLAEAVALAAEQARRDEQQDHQQRDQPAELVLRQPDERTGIGNDQQHEPDGNDDGGADEQHAVGLLPVEFR